MSSARTILTRGGVAVVLAGAGYMGFVHQWEDGGRQRNVVYADRLADGLPTACNGITRHTSPVPVVVGDYWSQEKCAAIARVVAEGGQISLARCITGPVTQSAFEAFSSHAHNFGPAQTCASRAMGLLNAGRLADACHALAWAPDGRPVWAYVGDRYIQGLHNRRLAERALCLRDSPSQP